MQPGNVDGHALEQESGALSGWFVAPKGEFVQKFLVAIDGAVGPRGAKLVRKESGLVQAPDYSPGRREAVNATARGLEDAGGRDRQRYRG